MGTPPVGSSVTASDDSGYFGESPAITIAKSTTTPVIESGGSVTWTILVTNTGNVPLTSVAVTDAATASCMNAYSANSGTLIVGGTWTFTCTSTGVTAGFTNTACVSGTDSLATTVSDCGSASVTVNGPAITIAKSTTTTTTAVAAATDPSRYYFGQDPESDNLQRSGPDDHLHLRDH